MELANPDANPTIAKVSSVWNDTLSTSNFETFNHHGYLSYELGGKLLVLTLNTILYAVRAFFAYYLNLLLMALLTDLFSHVCQSSQRTRRIHRTSKTRSASSRGSR